MTNTLTRVLAALALSTLTLTGCSAPVPLRICVGPETPDDLEDFLDRDLVRHPDFRCDRRDDDFEFVFVESPPAIGSELGDDGDLGIYRQRHSSRYRSTHPTPPAYRAPNLIPAPQIASKASTRPPAAAPAPSRPRSTPAPSAPRATPKSSSSGSSSGSKSGSSSGTTRK